MGKTPAQVTSFVIKTSIKDGQRVEALLKRDLGQQIAFNHFYQLVPPGDRHFILPTDSFNYYYVTFLTSIKPMKKDLMEWAKKFDARLIVRGAYRYMRNGAEELAPGEKEEIPDPVPDKESKAPTSFVEEIPNSEDLMEMNLEEDELKKKCDRLQIQVHDLQEKEKDLQNNLNIMTMRYFSLKNYRRRKVKNEMPITNPILIDSSRTTPLKQPNEETLPDEDNFPFQAEKITPKRIKKAPRSKKLTKKAKGLATEKANDLAARSQPSPLAIINENFPENRSASPISQPEETSVNRDILYCEQIKWIVKDNPLFWRQYIYYSPGQFIGKLSSDPDYPHSPAEGTWMVDIGEDLWIQLSKQDRELYEEEVDVLYPANIPEGRRVWTDVGNIGRKVWDLSII